MYMNSHIYIAQNFNAEKLVKQGFLQDVPEPATITPLNEPMITQPNQMPAIFPLSTSLLPPASRVPFVTESSLGERLKADGSQFTRYSKRDVIFIKFIIIIIMS